MEVFSCTIDGADVRLLVYNPPSVKAHYEGRIRMHAGRRSEYLARNSHIANINVPHKSPLRFLSSGLTKALMMN